MQGEDQRHRRGGEEAVTAAQQLSSVLSQLEVRLAATAAASETESIATARSTLLSARTATSAAGEMTQRGSAIGDVEKEIQPPSARARDEPCGDGPATKAAAVALHSPLAVPALPGGGVTLSLDRMYAELQIGKRCCGEARPIPPRRTLLALSFMFASIVLCSFADEKKRHRAWDDSSSC